MTDFMQQVVAGLASGGIYAGLALALVLIYRTTRVVNFAQGEMAMFTTFVAWTLMDRGLSFWPAFALTLAIAFVGGVAIERIVIRPVEGAGADGRDRHDRARVAPERAGFGALGHRGEELRERVLDARDRRRRRGGERPGHRRDRRLDRARPRVWLFFRFTKLGLALRAAAVNLDESRLVGIRVGWMLALGWGLAAVLGAVAGMLVAPAVFLEPNMMRAILLYAFAAAVLGGLPAWGERIVESPAVVYAVVLILLMLVLPSGAGGLLGRAGPLLTRRDADTV